MSKKNFGYIKIPLKRVHLELTNICDFNCIFCPKQSMKRPYGYMETELAKRVITELSRDRVCEKITFHVMGEPTMHPDFFDILAHAQREGLNVGLTTNGGRLGTAIGKRLLEYDIHQIDISLQTPDEKSFALRNAKKMTFDAYSKGIFDFFSAYKKTNRNTIFKFRFLNTSFRKKDMEKKAGAIKVISSTNELREAFRFWAGRIYEMLGIDAGKREEAMRRIGSLVSYKWNVVEICPDVFFETYILEDWGHAFDDGKIRDAWAGYCFGMKDHFGILHNGDVTLCCVDFDGNTKIGNLHNSSLKEMLSTREVAGIMKGFSRFKLVHPYCKRCLGSKSVLSWIFKPVFSIAALKLLKPFFYSRTKLYQ